jgi:hypothetical protein
LITHNGYFNFSWLNGQYEVAAQKENGDIHYLYLRVDTSIWIAKPTSNQQYNVYKIGYDITGYDDNDIPYTVSSGLYQVDYPLGLPEYSSSWLIFSMPQKGRITLNIEYKEKTFVYYYDQTGIHQTPHILHASDTVADGNLVSFSAETYYVSLFGFENIPVKRFEYKETFGISLGSFLPYKPYWYGDSAGTYKRIEIKPGTYQYVYDPDYHSNNISFTPVRATGNILIVIK